MEGGKRGRGTDQTPVLAGRTPIRQNASDSERERKTLIDFAQRSIEPGATISSDTYRSYNALAKDYDHQPLQFNVKEDPDHLKWLHTMISNRLLVACVSTKSTT